MGFIPFKKKSLSDEVKLQLQEYIKKMNLQNSTKLPSEGEIADSLGVSRVTVRKALTDLEQEGVVFRIHGKGTFANPEALKLDVNILLSKEFEQMINDFGYKANVKLVNVFVKPAEQEIAEKLNIGNRDLIIVMEKVFYADEHPAIFCVDMVPINLIGNDYEKENLELSVFETLRKKSGKIITWDKVSFDVISKENASKYYKNIHFMETDTFLLLRSTQYDQDNTPAMYDLEFYDTKYIKFTTIRQKNIRYSKI